jgi:hypothetical protein
MFANLKSGKAGKSLIKINMLRYLKRKLSSKYDELFYCIEEFSEGLGALASQDLLKAESKFQECLEKTAKKQYLGEVPHNTILKYLALTQRGLEKFSECSSSLLQISLNLERRDSPLKHQAFLDLVRHTLNTNPSKASQLTSSYQSTVPPSLSHEFLFLHGVIKN